MTSFKKIRKTIALMVSRQIERFPSSKKYSEKELLVVTTTGYGDTLWGIPALKILRKNNPEATISILVNPLSYEILKNCPYIDNFYIFQRKINFIFQWIRLIITLYKKRFKKVYFLHISETLPIVFCLFAQIKQRHGDSRFLRGFSDTFTHLITPEPADIIENRMRVVESTTHSDEEKMLELFLSNKDHLKKEMFLENHALKKQDNSFWIGMQPMSRLEKKEWPQENFVKVALKCIENYDAHIFLFGSPSEKKSLFAMKKKIPNATVVIDPLINIRSSMAMIGEMTLFITNDTGPMHAAFAQEIPTIALFGPTGISSADIYCSKKYFHPIRSKEGVMKTITPSTVLEKIKTLNL